MPRIVSKSDPLIYAALHKFASVHEAGLEVNGARIDAERGLVHAFG